MGHLRLLGFQSHYRFYMGNLLILFLSLYTPPSFLIGIDLFVLMPYKHKEKRLRKYSLRDSTLRHDITIEVKWKLLSSYSLFSMDVSRLTPMSKILLDVAFETIRP